MDGLIWGHFSRSKILGGPQHGPQGNVASTFHAIHVPCQPTPPLFSHTRGVGHTATSPLPNTHAPREKKTGPRMPSGWHRCFCKDLPWISPNTWFHWGLGSRVGNSQTVEALAGCGEQCESHSKKVESLAGLNQIFLNHLWLRMWGNEPSQTLGGLKVGGHSVEGNLAISCKMTNALIFDTTFPLLGF